LSAGTPYSSPYAGWWRRVGAALIDGLIGCGFLVAPLGAAAVVLYLTVEDDDTVDTLLNVVSIPFTIAFLLLYYPLTMRRRNEHNGQTWGKQACSIRVVRKDGQPFDASHAIMREVVVKYLLFSVVAACALFIPTLIDYLWPLWDDRNQALHDKMASTFVVRAEFGVVAAPPPPVQWRP
jgi:uncharacterized RDD family membrane protein YckC